ncbi:hypothetical protein GCM10020295_76220 [Streptomyces cinereospinus]
MLTGQSWVAILPNMLTMSSVSKSFLGARVLHGVSLDLKQGEIHALVGENGAGKSTLMKVLAGEYAPDEGTITLDGTARAFSHPVQAQAAGIALIHQEFALLPYRTVAENVFLGREPVRRGLVDRRAMERRTAELLAELDETGIDPRAQVGELSVARQQTVEIVKALAASDVRVLVMDEPTAPLADHEVGLLYALIRRLAARGIGILYISHRLREVFDLSQRITVLKDGRKVAALTTAETSPDEVVRAMVGRELHSYYPPRAEPGEIGEPLLTVTDAGNERLAGIGLTLRAGEVTGVAGLQGSGRTSLVRALFGAAPFTHGRMTVAGRSLLPGSPRQAIRGGIALVTEDRKAEGLALRQSVRDNALLVTRAVAGVGTRGGRRVAGPGRAALPRTGPGSALPLRGATSRRWSSPSGSPPAPGSCCSTNRPAVWTWARSPRSTHSCGNSPGRDSPCSSSPPNCPS